MDVCLRCGKETRTEDRCKGSRKDGTGAYCKPCNVARVQEARRRRDPAVRYRESDPAKAAARDDRWRERNPAVAALVDARYAAKRRARLGVATEPVLRAAVWERDGGICGICGDVVDGPWHMDHVVPLSRGGPHTYANVQVSHPRCNMRKGARL